MKNQLNAVVTITIGDRFKSIADITHPSIKAYADRIGAEFLVVTESLIKHPSWEKTRLFDLCDKFDRIIYLDTDIIVRKDCPNLFDIVPEEKIGAFNEGLYVPREKSLLEACNAYKEYVPNWDGTYYNAGVMVLSKCHKELFKRPSFIANLTMWEQSYFNIRFLNSLGKENIVDLPYVFNSMSLMDAFGKNKFDSYIIHYAGTLPAVDLCSIIKRDLEIVECY